MTGVGGSCPGPAVATANSVQRGQPGDDALAFGTDMTSAQSFPPDPGQRRLVILAAALGVLGVLVSIYFEYSSFRESRAAMAETIYRSNLAIARALASRGNPAAPRDTAEVVQDLAAAWERTYKPFTNTFLCVMDGSARLLKHTLRPESEGEFVGTMPITPEHPAQATNLVQLIERKADWSGRHVNLEGFEQLIAFAYAPELNGLVGVHVPADVVDDEITAAQRPWLLAVASLGGLIPASLALLLLVVRRTRRELFRSHEQLAASEARFARLFANNPAAIGMNTVDGGRLIEVNAQFCEFFGYAREEVIGRTVLELRFWAEPAQRDPIIVRLKRTGLVRDEEVRLRRKDGEVRDVLMSMVLLALPEEPEPVLIAMFVDITERKEAETEIRRLTGSLLRAQDDERRRLAAELHDTTAQTLAALTMNLSVIADSGALTDSKVGDLVGECQALADKSAREIRTHSYLLHPPLLDEFGLPRAIEDLTAGFTRRSGIQVELKQPRHWRRPGAEIEVGLYRVLQEALANVHRHSGSETVAVSLTQEDAAVGLEINDLGCGMRRGKSPVLTGVGIGSMRERMKHLGGTLDIVSGEAGTTVRAVVPVNVASEGVPGGRAVQSQSRDSGTKCSSPSRIPAA